MITFHLQNTVQDWPRAVRELPRNSVFKSVGHVHLIWEAYQNNNGILGILRQWYDYAQHYDTTDMTVCRNRADTFFKTFINPTFRQYAPAIRWVETWNETLANSQTPTEVSWRVAQELAMCQIWEEQYQAEFPWMGLMLANTAVGNNIPWQYAEMAHKSNYKHAIGYHGYVATLGNSVSFDVQELVSAENRPNFHGDGFYLVEDSDATPAISFDVNAAGQPVPGEWQWASGRWAVMADQWKSQGYHKFHIVNTEGGPVRSVNGGGVLDPQGGWRMLGDANMYVDIMRYWATNTANWNRANDNRCLGVTLFTTCNCNDWEWFDTRQPEMDMMANLAKQFPPLVTPPIDPPPPTTGNLLTNWSFEDGWNDDGNSQIPTGYTWGFMPPEQPNPHDPAPHSKFQRPEFRVLHRNNIPNEPEFIRHGDYTFKPFAGNKAWWGWLQQTKELSQQDTHRWTCWVFGDLVKGYTSNNQKIWADDPQGRDGLFRFMHNDTALTDWLSIIPGQWNEFIVDFVPNYHISILRVEWMCPFPLQNSGFFCDAWALEVIEEADCQFPTETRRHMLHPAVLNKSQRAQINDWVDNGIPAQLLGQTGDPIKVGIAGWSHTDEIIMVRDALQNGKPNSMLIVVDGHLIGTGLDYNWMRNNCPVVSPRTAFLTTFAITHWPTAHFTITQRFGTNPQNYAQFGLPGHDGVDIRAMLNDPIKSVCDGVVTQTDNIGNGALGKFVKIRKQHNTLTHEFTYAHLNSVGVVVNQEIVGGQTIGLAGNTGNSEGVHLHLGYKIISRTYKTVEGIVWPSNIHDPSLLLAVLHPELF